ncbi:hypothetical protein Nepgr_011671 [Nepenthes gracilis]|uniref:Uncharacterized protein n=1 Tax=Nepenthes gracilis TaxID=150966 RepID=A0AAD3SEH5_NEPGR|nr:hypothetical protein Nepgr_011671 [Nepenthes gracilis]
MRSYALRIFISLKFITANVVDRNSGGIVASASTVEQSVKSAFEYGRSSSPKAAAVVGEVLAMRLKVVGLDHPELAECGIHADVHKEIKKKGLENSAKIWAVINALRYYGVKLIIDDAPVN